MSRAETVNCTAITAVPATISSPGIYCLSSDIHTNMTSGSAITISADDVVLDLNGHTLSDSQAGTGTSATGISASNRKNVTVKNGTVRAFNVGISLDFVAGTGVPGVPEIATYYSVQHVTADGNRTVGIRAKGTCSAIRDNRVVDTGGLSVSESRGIESGSGAAIRIVNNTVARTGEPGGAAVASGTGRGIHVSNASSAVLEGNQVANEAGGTVSTGIYLQNCTKAMVVNNRLSSLENGIVYASSSGPLRDNILTGIKNPFSGGTKLLGNSIVSVTRSASS